MPTRSRTGQKIRTDGAQHMAVEGPPHSRPSGSPARRYPVRRDRISFEDDHSDVDLSLDVSGNSDESDEDDGNDGHAPPVTVMTNAARQKFDRLQSTRRAITANRRFSDYETGGSAYAPAYMSQADSDMVFDDVNADGKTMLTIGKPQYDLVQLKLLLVVGGMNVPRFVQPQEKIPKPDRRESEDLIRVHTDATALVRNASYDLHQPSPHSRGVSILDILTGSPLIRIPKCQCRAYRIKDTPAPTYINLSRLGP